MRTIQVTYRIQVPSVPNFLRTVEGQSVSIGAIKECGLREIGKEWTEELVKKAKIKAKK